MDEVMKRMETMGEGQEAVAPSHGDSGSRAVTFRTSARSMTPRQPQATVRILGVTNAMR